MKLELKHLAPYLPYGLKGNYLISDVVPTEKYELRDKLLTLDNIIFFLDYATPILCPLSDLNTYYVSQNILDRIKECSSKDIKEALNYNSISYLLENHFDIFGLIEQGLAIDINTLTP